MDVVELDTADESGLRAFWECEQAAIRADRAQPVIRTWRAFLAGATRPSTTTERIYLAAREAERTVGVVSLELTREDNLHLAELEVDVLPDVRRRGIGTALHDAAVARAAGRTTFLGEANAPTDGAGTAVPFAKALGYATVHQEDHLVLDLPADVPPPAVPGWSVDTWWGPCPEQWRAAYVAMRSQMEQDVPIGEIDWEPQPFTEALLAEEEQALDAWGRLAVTALTRADDGTLGGYSQVIVADGVDYAWQGDTLVMPEHRGHRLGLLMKSATLAEVQRRHPDRVALHTWTALTNGPMMHTNLQFGFRPVERLHEMQRVVS